MMKSRYNIFLLEKSCQILIELNEKNRVKVYVIKIIKSLADSGLITISRKGRNNFMEITDKGREAVTHIQSIIKLSPNTN